MDAQTLRRVLHDFFKFNPKDFYVKGSGTGYQVSAIRRSSNALTSALKVGFTWYLAPSTTPPADTPGLVIKLRKSLINENVSPENMADSFTLIPGTTESPKTNFVRCTTKQLADGTVNFATIDVTTDALSADPPGTLDSAPATSARALLILDCDETSIVDDSAIYIGGVSVLPQLVKTQCGESLWKMAWAHGL